MSKVVSKRKARTTLIIFFTMLIGPFFYAQYLFNNASRHPISTMNYGELFSPVVQLSEVPVSDNTPESMLKHKWGFVFATVSEHCDGECEKALYHMRQIHKALHKNQTRVTRLAWLGPQSDKAQFAELIKESYAGMRTFDIIGDIQTLSHHQDFKQGMFVIDPRGNMVLEYAADADPKKTLKDIKRLLSVSQIG